MKKALTIGMALALLIGFFIALPVVSQVTSPGRGTLATLLRDKGFIQVISGGTLRMAPAVGKHIQVGSIDGLSYQGGQEYAQVTIATGAVLTLNTTPVQLVAAPGTGSVVIVDDIAAKLVRNSITYTTQGVLEFRYTDGSGAKVSADIANTLLFTSSGTGYQTVKGVATALIPVANAAIVVDVPTGNPAAGNSPLVITVRYHISTP